MKKIIALLFVVSTFPCFAQMRHLNKLAEEERNEYLVKVAKEVTDSCGPGWNRGVIVPLVSELKVYKDSKYYSPEIRKNSGREYYEVKLMYNRKTQQETGWICATNVHIWEDDGTPVCVLFGDSYGFDFSTKPFKEWYKNSENQDPRNPFKKLRIIDGKVFEEGDE